MASMSSLDLVLSSTDIGIDFSVVGYSEKAFNLLLMGLTYLFLDETKFCSNILARQLEILEIAYSNAGLTASNTAKDARLCALKKDRYSYAEKLANLNEFGKNIDNLKTKLIEYFSQFTTNICVESLVYGKLSATNSIELGQQLIKLIQDAKCSLNLSNYPAQPIVIVPQSAPVIINVSPSNLLEENDAIECYFQLGPFDLKSLTLLNLLDQILFERFYDTLRTHEQIGYSVSCGVRETFGILGFCFHVVSASCNLEEIRCSIFKFVESIPDLLASMRPQLNDPSQVKSAVEYIFSDHIKSLIDLKIRPDSTLLDAAKTRWSLIEERCYFFDRSTEQAAFLIGKVNESEFDASYPEKWDGKMSLSKLTNFQDELVEFSKKVFIDKKSTRILIVQSSTKNLNDQEKSVNVVHSKKFKANNFFDMNSAKIFNNPRKFNTASQNYSNMV
jgi:secreted Zn-dependent insulinase-like peptidase